MVPEIVLPDPVVRELKPGEVSLDDLEAAFLAAPGPDEADFAAFAPAPVAVVEPVPAKAAPVPVKAEPAPVEAPAKAEAAAAVARARTRPPRCRRSA